MKTNEYTDFKSFINTETFKRLGQKFNCTFKDDEKTIFVCTIESYNKYIIFITQYCKILTFTLENDYLLTYSKLNLNIDNCDDNITLVDENMYIPLGYFDMMMKFINFEGIISMSYNGCKMYNINVSSEQSKLYKWFDISCPNNIVTSILYYKAMYDKKIDNQLKSIDIKQLQEQINDQQQIIQTYEIHIDNLNKKINELNNIITDLEENSIDYVL